MIYKGLDEEEAGFLTMVAQRQAQEQEDSVRREMAEVNEYRVSLFQILTFFPRWKEKPHPLNYHIGILQTLGDFYSD